MTLALTLIAGKHWGLFVALYAYYHFLEPFWI